MDTIPIPSVGIPAMLTPKPVIQADTVARMLGLRSANAFIIRRAGLETAGFPPKLPGINGWSYAAILRWIDDNGAPSPAPRVNALAERYGARA